MKLILDTNVYFAAIHEPRFLDANRSLFLRIGPITYLSSVVRCELLQGARGDLGRARVSRATRQLERAGRVVTPNHGDWTLAATIQGRIWDEHPSLRTKRLLNDILIVCGARRVGALVVTENATDFTVIRPYLPHRALRMAELAEALG